MERRTPYNYSYKGLLILFHTYRMFIFLKKDIEIFFYSENKSEIRVFFFPETTFLTPFKKKK